MSNVIHARLDAETKKLLTMLQKRYGWTDSKMVREGLKALASISPRSSSTIIGQGRFRSGITDLASNKRHLDGFGK